MKWIDFPDDGLQVFGLPWFKEDSPNLWRLPSRMKEDFRPDVWNLATQPSGGRVRFSTDSTRLSVRASYKLGDHMENMCRIGQAGIACYIDGVLGRVASPVERELTAEFYWDRPKAPAEVTLYLPLYHPVELVAVGIDDDAVISPPAPFAATKPVVFYGSSITQGGCASQPGNSYQAMLCRDLDIDFVNLGFSGNGIGEPELARAVASIDASCFVIDFAINCESVDSARAAYGPFLETIRASHPETPVICMTLIAASPEAWEDDWGGVQEGKRNVIRDAFKACIDAGDGNITLIEGHELLGPADVDGLVDGVHPNDLGFRMMADGLREPLRAALVL